MSPVHVSPGIHSLSPADYHAHPAIGASFLKDADADCLAYARWHKDHPDAPSSAWTTQRRSTALHMMLLEPDAFEAHYVVGTGCDAVLKSGERAGKSCGSASGRFVRTPGGLTRFYCGKHDDPMLVAEPREAMTIEASDELAAMATSLRAVGGDLLAKATHKEASFVWTDPETGVLCKCRPDLIVGSTIYDVKALADVSPARWGKILLDNGMFFQPVHYVAGAQACGLDVQHFAWLTVANTPPYLAVVHPPMDEVSLDVAETFRADLLRRIAACEQSGNWEPYAAPEVTRLPEWFLNTFSVGV